MSDVAKASAPGKLILMGEHAVVYGFPCIVTAVDQTIQVEARIVDQPEDRIIAPQVEKTDFIDELVVRFKRKYSLTDSIEIKTHAELSNKTGLGSSSASTVAVCKALNQLFNLKMSEQDIFDMSFQTVLHVQGSGSGTDIAAAVYGGMLYFQNKGEKCEKLCVKDMHIVIGNTGRKAPTKEYIQQVVMLREQKPKYVEGIFQEISELVHTSREYIQTRDFIRLGDAINRNHDLLRKLDVSSEKLEDLTEAARGAGALGAKLSGAGGGDNMFALVSSESRSQVEKAIEKAGGTVIHAEIDYESNSNISS